MTKKNYSSLREQACNLMPEGAVVSIIGKSSGRENECCVGSVDEVANTGLPALIEDLKCLKSRLEYDN